jgi:hypothetical protein
MVSREDLEKGLTNMFRLNSRDIPAVDRFARSYFPSGCNYYSHGQLSPGGRIFAYIARKIKPSPQPCLICRDDDCKARVRPYQNE